MEEHVGDRRETAINDDIIEEEQQWLVDDLGNTLLVGDYHAVVNHLLQVTLRRRKAKGTTMCRMFIQINKYIKLE